MFELRTTFIGRSQFSKFHTLPGCQLAMLSTLARLGGSTIWPPGFGPVIHRSVLSTLAWPSGSESVSLDGHQTRRPPRQARRRAAEKVDLSLVAKRNFHSRKVEGEPSCSALVFCFQKADGKRSGYFLADLVFFRVDRTHFKLPRTSLQHLGHNFPPRFPDEIGARRL